MSDEPSPPKEVLNYEYTKLCAEMGAVLMRAWVELHPRIERILALESQAALIAPATPTESSKTPSPSTPESLDEPEAGDPASP